MLSYTFYKLTSCMKSIHHPSTAATAPFNVFGPCICQKLQVLKTLKPATINNITRVIINVHDPTQSINRSKRTGVNSEYGSMHTTDHHLLQNSEKVAPN